MTFWKFFIIILFIYIVYYSVMLLLEKMKTQKSVIPITSKRVDFVVEQPKPAMANEAIKSFEIETDEEDNEVEEPAGTGTDNEEANNIFDDLGIEAYFSNSIDVTEDNLLTLINE